MAKLTVLFIAAQVLGLVVAVNFIGSIQTGEMERTGVITENPEDVENAIGLFVYILVFTGVLLLALHFFKGEWLFRLLEIIVVFTTSLIVFFVFFPSVAFMLAVLLVITRQLLPTHIWLRNLSSVISVAAVGSMIGISLGVFPTLLFMVLLSVYDFIAVFKTKHMVTLAKGITKKNLAFTFAIPSKELKHQFELGTGDMVIPLTFAVSVMSAAALAGIPFPNYILPAGLILIGSLVGLLWTIDYSSKHVGKALPALPPQTVLMLAMWLVGKAIGF